MTIDMFHKIFLVSGVTSIILLVLLLFTGYLLDIFKTLSLYFGFSKRKEIRDYGSSPIQEKDSKDFVSSSPKKVKKVKKIKKRKTPVNKYKVDDFFEHTNSEPSEPTTIKNTSGSMGTTLLNVPEPPKKANNTKALPNGTEILSNGTTILTVDNEMYLGSNERI